MDAAAFEDGILEFLGHTKWVERFGDGIGIEAIDEVGLVEMEDAPGVFTNADWNDEWLEVICSDVWGLSLSFPQVTEA